MSLQEAIDEIRAAAEQDRRMGDGWTVESVWHTGGGSVVNVERRGERHTVPLAPEQDVSPSDVVEITVDVIGRRFRG